MESNKHMRVDNGVVAEDAMVEAWGLGDMPTDVLIHIARFLPVPDLTYYGLVARAFLPVARWVYASRHRKPYSWDDLLFLVTPVLPVPPRWTQAVTSDSRIMDARDSWQLPPEGAAVAAASMKDDGRTWLRITTAHEMPPSYHRSAVVATYNPKWQWLTHIICQHATNRGYPNPFVHPMVIQVAAELGVTALVTYIYNAAGGSLWGVRGREIPVYPQRPSSFEVARIALLAAARLGHVALFSALPRRSLDIETVQKIARVAARHNRASVLDELYVRSRIMPTTPGITGPAVKRQCAAVLDWLYATAQVRGNHPLVVTRFIRHHLMLGNMAEAERYLENHPYQRDTLWNYIVKCGDVPQLDWMAAHSPPVSNEGMISAVRLGRVVAVRWFLAQGLGVDARAWVAGIANGQTEVLEVLRASGAVPRINLGAVSAAKLILCDRYRDDAARVLATMTWADAHVVISLE